MAQAVEAAWRSGITVVCAAGNEGDFGPGSILSPGNDPFVITVGADDTKQTAATADDSIASYSSVGPTLFDEIVKPDVVAPGQRVVSTRAAGSFIDVNFPANIIPLADYDADADCRHRVGLPDALGHERLRPGGRRRGGPDARRGRRP